MSHTTYQHTIQYIHSVKETAAHCFDTLFILETALMMVICCTAFHFKLESGNFLLSSKETRKATQICQIFKMQTWIKGAKKRWERSNDTNNLKNNCHIDKLNVVWLRVHVGNQVCVSTCLFVISCQSFYRRSPTPIHSASISVCLKQNKHDTQDSQILIQWEKNHAMLPKNIKTINVVRLK